MNVREFLERDEQCWYEPFGCRARPTLTLVISGPRGQVRRRSCHQHLPIFRRVLLLLNIRVTASPRILPERVA